MKKKILAALLGLAIIAAALFTYADYRKAHDFPGRFLLPQSGYDIYDLDRYGWHRLRPGFTWAKKGTLTPFGGDDRPLYKIVRSHNGVLAAYFRKEKGLVTQLVVRKVDKLNDVPRDMWFGTDFISKHTEPLKFIDVSRYKIPLPVLGNMQWSPDDKMLALADNNNLYIVDIHSGHFWKGRLPRDKDFDIFYNSWQTFAPEANLSNKSFDEVCQYFKRHYPMAPETYDIYKSSDKRLRQELKILSE